jgi:hypothetical protein
MAGERDYGREVRDTVVKSGLTGVAATVLAVTVFSPAGLGGMIGTSVASGLGLDASTPAANDPYANLPAYPAPLTDEELNDIRGKLASTAASLEITRAATDERIERVRAIADADGLVTFTTAPRLVEVAQPATLVVQPTAPVTPAAAPVVATAVMPVSHAPGGGVDGGVYYDRNFGLTDLRLVDELF